MPAPAIRRRMSTTHRPTFKTLSRCAPSIFPWTGCVLPLEVLEQARDELLDWRHSGMSVMEISHRGQAFMQVAAEAEADFRELLSIPRNYQVLFMQGGASAQFSLIPMNLAASESSVDYVNTGPLVAEGHRRSGAVLPRAHRRRCRRRLHAGPRAGRVALERGCPLCAFTRRTRPSAGSSSATSRNRASRSLPICRRASCRGRSTSRNLA